MTNEEAINRLSKNNCKECASDCKNCEIGIAKKVIEKQIPIAKHKYGCFYRCKCSEIVGKHQDYCEYCGQRLLDVIDKNVSHAMYEDWSDIDE